ncbi:MAG TPA: metal ABC transporter substrate-binding protein [Polyangia bacterium]
MPIKLISFVVSLAALLVSSPAAAASKLKVACTLSTIESLVREVGGDRVDAFALSAGDQDPHTVAPTPSLMNRVRKADLLLEIGMQLEMWADQVADGSGNPRVFHGAPGRVSLSSGIPKREVPEAISRSQGDVHPEGNPHLWLDPVRAKLLAANVAAALKTAAPADAAYFDGRLGALQKRIDRALFGEELLAAVGSAKLSRLALDGQLIPFLAANQVGGKKLADLAGGWLAKAQSLRGQKVVEYHKVWSYFAATFGFSLVGTIEEKPGIPPGPRHVTDTVDLIKRDGVRLILVDNFYDPALPKRIAQAGGARIAIVPNQVGGDKGINDYFSLMDQVINAMTGAR